MTGQEFTMWAVLAAYGLTALNMARAQRLYDAARREREETLATVKKAFALHNCGAREEAMAVLLRGCGPKENSAAAHAEPRGTKV